MAPCRTTSDVSDQVVDVIVIGAGPVGLACAIDAQRAGLSARVIDKGALVNSIVGYPARMEFFSTPDLIEIGGYPFPVQGYKPTREEGLEYYRGVAAREQVDIRLYERVLALHGSRGDFLVETSRGRHRARHVIVATGFFDLPNRLGVPGEDLPHVTHYYREPYPYVQQRVAVVGAKNSAAKAALDCYRHGAQVTLMVRGAALSETVKYWIKPDLENRIKEGSIRAYFDTTVDEIREGSLLLRTPEGACRVAERLRPGHDGLSAGLRVPVVAGHHVRRRWVQDPGVRRDDVREREGGRVPCRHGVRRTEDQSLVHRERPVPRAADRQAPGRPADRGHPVRGDALEDRGVGRVSGLHLLDARPLLALALEVMQVLATH